MTFYRAIKELKHRETVANMNAHKYRMEQCPTMALMADATEAGLRSYRLWLEYEWKRKKLWTKH